MNWNFGEPSSGAGNTSTLTNPAHTYASTGTYTVTLIVHYTCSSDTVKIPVSVTSVSTMSLSGTFTICAKDKRVYTASGASNYTWTGGVTTSTIALSPTVTTAYTLTGAASSSNTCANVKIFTITVNKCTGIETADNEGDLKIYPNPSNGILTIETDRKTKVLITDAVGKIMSESVFEAGVFSMNIKDYQSGIYIIKSTSGKGTKIIRLVKTE